MIESMNNDMKDFLGNRRLARVAISVDLLKDLITVNHEVRGNLKCVKGIPEDAVFIGSSFDDDRQIAYLIFYHQSFDLMPTGSSIPIIHIGHEFKL